MEVAIEAVTVNPSQSGKDATAPKSPDEAAKLIHDYVPIKFGSPLYSKLQKRYWEKEIVAGKPFILAIHDFHQPGSMLWTHTGLMIYLYGYHHEHEFDESGRLVVKPVKVERHIWGDKDIPSGFFNLPDSENISAVLSTSGATISKFLRMGKLADFGDPRVRILRQGAAMMHDPNANTPQRFEVVVDPDHYFESWSESVSIYHNPNAKIPLTPELFPSVAHHFLQEDGQIRSQIPPVHVFASITVTTLNE